MRRWAVLLCLAGMLCILPACGQEKREEVAEITEITLLHGRGTMEANDQKMREIYMDFAEENPDIRLNIIAMPSDEKVNTKTREMLAVGKMPDIVFIGGGGKDNLYTFMVEYGYALDLMPYLLEDTEFADSISPKIREYWTTDDGALYMVTDVLMPVGYWYNRQIFQNAGVDQVPATWEEFYECCEKIRVWALEEKLNTIVFHLDPETCMYFTEAYRTPQKDGKSGLDVTDAGFSLALDQLKLLEQYGGVESEEYTWRDRIRSFNMGHSAICVNGVWTEQLLQKNLKAEYALFPSENGESTGFLSAGCGYIVGNTGDKKKEEACIRFLKYMLSESVQLRIFRETGQIPSNPQVNLKNYAYSNEELYKAYQTVLEADHCRELPSNVWTENQKKLFESNIEDFLNGRLTKQQLKEILKEHSADENVMYRGKVMQRYAKILQFR